MTKKSSKKKILHVVEAFGGGVYTFLVPLANSTCEEFDVTIAYSLRPQTPASYQTDLNPKIRLIKGENFTRNFSIIRDIKSIFEIRRIIREVQPDIIHLHSSKSGFIGRLAINCKKYKVFYSPHGFAFLKQDDSRIKRYIYYIMERVAALSHCTTIGVSKSECEIASRLSKRATYINNGVLLYNGTTPPAPVHTEHPVICGVGRICYQKNPVMFNNIAKAFPNLKFLWIGDGEMRDTFTSNNITITGWISREETISYLKKADIFLLPSYWEGLPIALLEAMYEGKICIATPVTGICDVIRPEQNGFLATTLEDYIGTIRNIIDGAYDIEAITKQAFQDILTTYNSDIMIKQYTELYRNSDTENIRKDLSNDD